MRLKTHRVRATAPRELVYEVIASAGRDVGDWELGRLVEFETEWHGRSFKTTEAVIYERPDRIIYRWVTGPLVGVEEEINLREQSPQITVMTYRGSFQPPAGFVGWFRGVSVVRPIFNRLARDHLDQGKRLAETRALRSRLYPRLPNGGRPASERAAHGVGRSQLNPLR